MGCMRYVVTGGTGFIGGRVVSRLLDTQPNTDPAEVWVLVRRRSLGRVERLAGQWGERAKPLVGELPELSLTDETIAELGRIDHLVHCAAIYDLTAGEAVLLVRSTPGLRYRVYRPAVVVGDSRTGEMAKIDGPYYFFGVLAKLAVLPSFTPILL